MDRYGEIDGTHSPRELRIGVDVSSLSAPMAGIGRYVKELLSRLTQMQYEWFLYSCEPLYDANLSGLKVNFRILQKPEWMPRALWFQSLLPMQLHYDRIDLFWCPAHRLPLFLPKAVKRVVTIHDLVWRHAPNSMRIKGLLLDRLLMPHALRSSDRIIAVSKSTSNDIVSEFPRLDIDIDVIGLGASHLLQQTRQNDAKALHNNLISTPYFLFVGTLEPRKNLARLIEAFSLLPSDCRGGLSLVIVGGNGWGRVKPQDLGVKFGVSKNLVVLNRVSDAELTHLYKNCICLTLPSLYEGFGLPIIEAMANGAPVLTSNLSSMPEVAGSAAILVDPYDTTSITDGLSKILNNEVQLRLRKAAIINSQRYSWDVAAVSTLSIFQELLSAS